MAGSGGSPGCQSNAACDDGLYCNGAEACVNGVCVAGSNPCDDGVNCTVDACDESIDACTNLPDGSLCPSDGIACNGVEVCDAVLGCTSVNPPNCDDGIACTADFCDPQSGACAHVPNDNDCSNGKFCDGLEICDTNVGCVAGPAPDCADGVACTDDACDPALDACAHVPNAGKCSDGLFCNGAETCDASVGCLPGAPPNCNDGVSCTVDSCDEIADACDHDPIDAACSDGLVCNGAETCNPVSGCQAGVPVPCGSDGISCTVDACDEATGQCAHVAQNGLCPNGEFCVVLQGGCTTGQPCQNAAQCSDGDACNGVEACVNGICAPGAPVNCDDGVGCTVDSCNPATGTCTHNANDVFCSDGLACNGVEACDAQLGCVVTIPAPNCNDGVGCTIDGCVEPGGFCVNSPLDALCSDGKLCNGLEVCNAQTGCQPAAAPYVCPDDGIACTAEVCSPLLNACVKIPDNSACACGQTCDPSQGCGNFCKVATCQGKVYQCGDCLDNDNDCSIDSVDSQCLGPCDNTENSFYGGIPGQNNSPCKSDCYFDADTGSGNDDCYWSHKCDPLEVAPNYPPEGSQCAYNPNANIPGYAGTCASAFASQSPQCGGYCGPLTPNGCDCFGCCAIPGAPTTVWLGSENPSGVGSCNINTLNDPTKCKPCTQVAACLNTCDNCEICVGKPTLPPECVEQTCPAGQQKCGQVNQPLCPDGQSCITGCCVPNPQ